MAELDAAPAFTVDATGITLTRSARSIPWDRILAAGVAPADPSTGWIPGRQAPARYGGAAHDRILLVQHRSAQRNVVATLPANGDVVALRTALGDRWLGDDQPYPLLRAQLKSRVSPTSQWAACLSVLGFVGSCLLAGAVPVVAGGLADIAAGFVFERFGWLVITIAGVAVIVWGSRMVSSHGQTLDQTRYEGVSGMIWGVITILAGVLVMGGSLIYTFAPRTIASLQSARGFGVILLTASLFGFLWAASSLISTGRHGAQGFRGVLATSREIVAGAIILAAALGAAVAGGVLVTGLLNFGR